MFGEDFGRTGDLTDIWPLAITTAMHRRTPFVVELRNIPYREQEAILFYIVDRLPRFLAGALDATGNGGYLAERAAQRNGAGRIEMVKLSTEWCREEMPPYKAAFEDGTIVISKHADIIGDHRAVVMDQGVAKVPAGVHNQGLDGKPRHGDSAIAGALAYYASRIDVVEYGYAPAALPPGPADERSGYEDDGGYLRIGSGLHGLRGAI